MQVVLNNAGIRARAALRPCNQAFVTARKQLVSRQTKKRLFLEFKQCVRYQAKPCVCQAANTGSAETRVPDAADEDDEIRANIERASQILDGMIREVCDALFLEEGAAYIQDSKPELSHQEVVRAAVAARIDLLDGNFLAVLNAYLDGVMAQDEGQQTALVQLLAAVREEVLKQVAERLPPAVQLLGRVVQQEGSKDRMQLLRNCLLSGGDAESGLPAVDFEGIIAAASQFIQDMEEQEVVPDRRLLARLCLVREEVRMLDTEQTYTSSSSEEPGFQRSNVPQRCVAFLKELLAVSDQRRRVALLEKAFRDDWDGAAPKNSNTEFMESSDGPQQPDYVRPGRFLATLHRMKMAMKEQSQDSVVQLQRLNDVHMEAMAMLDKIQRSQLGPAPAS